MHNQKRRSAARDYPRHWFSQKHATRERRANIEIPSEQLHQGALASAETFGNMAHNGAQNDRVFQGSMCAKAAATSAATQALQLRTAIGNTETTRANNLERIDVLEIR